MGYALAQAALDEGASVTLVAGPTHLVPPYGVDVVHVTTAEEMLTAVTASTEDADVLIMAAAVADFRPPAAAPSKIKKQRADAGLTLELVRNPDILATVTWPQLLKIGFAAETEDLEANAAGKLRAKGLALIVANDAVSTIGGRDSTATLIAADLSPERLPTMSKDDLAKQIIDRVVSLLSRRESTQADA